MKSGAERLRAARAAKQLSQVELAQASGISQQMISKLERGATALEDSSEVYPIAKALGVSVGELLPAYSAGEAAPEDKYQFATRVHGAVLSAGSGAVTWEHEEIEGSHAFTRTWLQRKRLKIENCRVLTIQGDSMLPELRDGFVVLIDLSDCAPIKSGKVYALSVDGEQRIKRLFRQVDGSLRISSDNPDKSHFPDEIVQPEHLDRIRIIGRKRWHAGDDD